MRQIGLTILLLTLSNVFMTFAWYAHLKELSAKPWLVAALVSWGIAFFEYMLQVPANRIGYGTLSLGQLKILQEVITLSVVVPFAVYYMKEPLKLDYLWAGLCILGAVYFIFRGEAAGAWLGGGRFVVPALVVWALFWSAVAWVLLAIAAPVDGPSLGAILQYNWLAILLSGAATLAGALAGGVLAGHQAPPIAGRHPGYEAR